MFKLTNLIFLKQVKVSKQNVMNKQKTPVSYLSMKEEEKVMLYTSSNAGDVSAPKALLRQTDTSGKV